MSTWLRLAAWQLAVALVLTACSTDTLPEGSEVGLAPLPEERGPAADVPGQGAARTDDSVPDVLPQEHEVETLPGAGEGAEETGQEPGQAPARPRDVDQRTRPQEPAAEPADDNASTSTPTTAVGVTDDTIAISVSGFFSGPYAGIVEKQYQNGFLTWVDEVNAGGGVHGRQVVVRKVDNQDTAEGQVAACKEASTNGTFVTHILVGHEAHADCLDELGVPATIQGSESDSPSWRSVRALQSGAAVGATLANFAKWELGAAGAKVGLLVVDQPQFMGTAGEFAKAARQLGLDLVTTERAAQNQASFVAELSRMRNAGVEIAVILVGTEILGILRDARAIGYQPEITGFWWTVDELSQAARNLMDGLTGLSAKATTDSEAFEEFETVASRHRRFGVNSTDLWGYGQGRVFGHVLEAAGPNPTRDSFVAAMDDTQGFDSRMTPPVSWSPQDQVGFRAYFPVVCCNPDWTWRALGPAREHFGP